MSSDDVNSPTGSPRWPRLFAILAPGAALVAVLAWASLQGRPVALSESASRTVPCVSYAPFRRPGETPFDPELRIAPERIADDLRRLATVTSCVRTYGLDHGLDAVPEVARRLGLRVVLGAWVGRDAAANANQLGRALALARSHADVIDLLVVGNEVLLRRELSPPALAELLARAKRASPVPVAYADVWEFWLRHGEVLQPRVDVVAAHVLPYWEDEPVGVEAAVDHVHAIAARLRRHFGPTPVWVAETGWPAAGRQRGRARPGALEQARFIRELLAREAVSPIGFNLVEGFDQPWKRALEGAMGGGWGLFDADGARRVAFSEPLVPDRRWAAAPLSALLGALLIWAACARRGHAVGAALLGGGLVGACGWLAAAGLADWSRDGLEWGIGLARLAASLLCGGLAARELALRLAGAMGMPRWLDAARQVLLFVAGADALTLLFDGRYRPLEWALFAAPGVLMLALTGLGDARARAGLAAARERLLALICAGSAVGVLVVEGPANTQALLYTGALLTLALASLRTHRDVPAAGNRASAATSAAGADSPAQ